MSERSSCVIIPSTTEASDGTNGARPRSVRRAESRNAETGVLRLRASHLPKAKDRPAVTMKARFLLGCFDARFVYGGQSEVALAAPRSLIRGPS